ARGPERSRVRLAEREKTRSQREGRRSMLVGRMVRGLERERRATAGNAPGCLGEDMVVTRRVAAQWVHPPRPQSCPPATTSGAHALVTVTNAVGDGGRHARSGRAMTFARLAYGPSRSATSPPSAPT